MPTNTEVINGLINSYVEEVDLYVDRLKKDSTKAIPFIVSRISLTVVPNMMHDVATIQGLTGHQKKQLVEDAIICIIDRIHQKIDLEDQIWDDYVRDMLKTIIPPTIDLLIDVEKGKLVFNKRTRTLVSSCISR